MENKLEMVKYTTESINRILEVLDTTTFTIKGVEQFNAFNEILQILTKGGMIFYEDAPVETPVVKDTPVSEVVA